MYSLTMHADNFFYQTRLSLNLVKLKNFQYMIDVIDAYEPNLSTSTYHEIKMSLLNIR